MSAQYTLVAKIEHRSRDMYERVNSVNAKVCFTPPLLLLFVMLTSSLLDEGFIDPEQSFQFRILRQTKGFGGII